MQTSKAFKLAMGMFLSILVAVGAFGIGIQSNWGGVIALGVAATIAAVIFCVLWRNAPDE